MKPFAHSVSFRFAGCALLLAVPALLAQTPTQATTPSQTKSATPAASKPAATATPGQTATPAAGTQNNTQPATPQSSQSGTQTTTPPLGTTPSPSNVPALGTTPNAPSTPTSAPNPSISSTAADSSSQSRGGGLSVAIPAELGKASIPQPAAGATISLDQALSLAVANEPTFVAAAAAARTAKLDKSIARAGILPSAVYHNQYLYTQPLSAGAHGAAATPANDTVKFVANNTIHEYVSQLQLNENLGLTQYLAIQKADSALAIANAELEIARRGLTSTVVGLFYNLITGQTRVAVQQRAVDEAADFLKQTQNREQAREVAHADVLKAQIQLQQHQRDLADAQLAYDKARLDLGVLIYPDPRTQYTVTVPDVRPIPDRATIETSAAANNAELKSAAATYRSAQVGVTSAIAAFFPDLSLNYSYGIDAPQFATNAPDGSRYLGYSASATIDIPLFDWLATPNKVKQAHIARDAAKISLNNTQRRVIANLEEFYAEARVAFNALTSLQQTVDDSRESLRLTRLRYTNGEATVLEVVDAQNTLTTAELALQDGTVRYQLALANLQTLTGTI